ncbi:hypothetical protein FA95DRAFT_653486 [Auriscalpium vulgare]|uniref:Uncharacterized protein n=1 Tax=Auriscalpium vulgare TaxID=40419 RepID=A0ACB8RCC1_9AGAM|nr:hypothetical protein FA95DRAFT_653486 [Auriscalpium vulgare]
MFRSRASRRCSGNSARGGWRSPGGGGSAAILLSISIRVWRGAAMRGLCVRRVPSGVIPSRGQGELYFDDEEGDDNHALIKLLRDKALSPFGTTLNSEEGSIRVAEASTAMLITSDSNGPRPPADRWTLT